MTVNDNISAIYIMSEQHKQVIEGLDILKEKVKALEMQSNTSRVFVLLNDFPNLIEKYCSNNGIKNPTSVNLPAYHQQHSLKHLKIP